MAFRSQRQGSGQDPGGICQKKDGNDFKISLGVISDFSHSLEKTPKS